jgi:hypothetical protein
MSNTLAPDVFPSAEADFRQSQNERGDEIFSQLPGGIATSIVLQKEKQFRGIFGIFDLSSDFDNNE